MDESIEMPFRMWNQLGPRKHILDGMDILVPPGKYS